MVKLSSLLAIFVLSATAWAGNAPCPEAGAATAVSGDTVALKDGSLLHLRDIKAPELWGEGAPYASWPGAAGARAYLARLLDHRDILPDCLALEGNRLGDLVGDIRGQDGHSVARMMVEGGWAYVWPREDNPPDLAALRQAEAAARAQGLGVWTTDNPAVRTVEGGDIRPGWFHIVRGKVVAAAEVRGTIYLNFGPDWRTDFTMEIPPSAWRAFRKADFDIADFKDVEVEGRGWVDYKNGPRLLLEGPGQIEILPH